MILTFRHWALGWVGGGLYQINLFHPSHLIYRAAVGVGCQGKGRGLNRHQNRFLLFLATQWGGLVVAKIQANDWLTSGVWWILWIISISSILSFRESLLLLVQPFVFGKWKYFPQSVSCSHTDGSQQMNLRFIRDGNIFESVPPT